MNPVKTYQKSFEVAECYRYTFNGQEEDKEIADGVTTAMFWEYDSRLGRRWNIDPASTAWGCIYDVFHNNPIRNIDPNGDTVKVNNAAGKWLFDLYDGKKDITTLTAKQAYDKGYQWFEPLADNYMPIAKMNPAIGRMEGIPHFSWNQIQSFAEVDLFSFQYGKDQAGDWKSSPYGANGYFLVTVGGKPFWADAIGQIPFAVDTYRDEIKNTDGNVDEAIRNVIAIGRDHGDGSFWGGAQINNGYDDYIILRACLWASKRYTYAEPHPKKNGSKMMIRHQVDPVQMDTPINKEQKVKYLESK